MNRPYQLYATFQRAKDGVLGRNQLYPLNLKVLASHGRQTVAECPNGDSGIKYIEYILIFVYYSSITHFLYYFNVFKFA